MRFFKNSGSTPEAMGTFVELSLTGTSHNEDCYYFLKNLRDGDDFLMYGVTRGGSAARPVEIHTSSPFWMLFSHMPPLMFPSKLQWS
jgi:hypothetical protein